MKKESKRPELLFNVDTVANKLQCLIREDFNATKNSIDPFTWNTLCNYQIDDFTKKFRFQHNTVDTKRVALERFKDVLKHTANIHVDSLLSEGLLSRESNPLDFVHRKAKHVVHQILGELDLEEIFSLCKHGPGVSSGVKYKDLSLSSKVSLPIDVSSSALSIYDAYILWDHTLRDMIQQGNPTWKFSRLNPLNYRLVEHSRITTVPKNNKTDRVIAIEPTANMFLQQGIGRVIANRLSLFGVDLSTQPDVNSNLARHGSITGDYATIDFSSASDCVGLDLVKSLLPRNWFELINACRTSTVIVDGDTINTPCLATMGNACTFPIETLVFYSLAIACHSYNNENRYSRYPEWESFNCGISVFGDDCILPTDDVNLFLDVCEKLGFIINEDKSFFLRTEKFRESCGSDFLSGRNIRPYYLRAPRSFKPSVLHSWLYITWNGLLKKLISSFGEQTYCYNCSCLEYLASLINMQKQIHLVCASDPDDSGVKLYGDPRLLYLFDKKKIPTIRKDIHGTYTYKRLHSALVETENAKVQEIEYWYSLKFPPINLESKSLFEVERRDHGYVVIESINYTSELNGLTPSFFA